MNREQGTGDRESLCLSSSPGGHTPPTRQVLLFAIIALLIFPIFAHGCHRWDHDDEPNLIPIDHRAASMELPR
jgi:hypothetical protein